MSWVLAAFWILAYALFEIPSGWMGDRFGPRKALIRVVLWWSFFTILTGVTGGFISLFCGPLFVCGREKLAAFRISRAPL